MKLIEWLKAKKQRREELKRAKLVKKLEKEASELENKLEADAPELAGKLDEEAAYAEGELEDNVQELEREITEETPADIERKLNAPELSPLGAEDIEIEPPKSRFTDEYLDFVVQQQIKQQQQQINKQADDTVSRELS